MSIPPYLLRSSTNQDTPLDDLVWQYQPWLATWLIEFALAFGWARPDSAGEPSAVFEEPDFLRLAGLEPLEDEEDDDRVGRGDRRGVGFYEGLLRVRLREVKAQELSPELPLFANLELLTQALGLSQGEQVLLAFAVVVDQFQAFKGAISPFTSRISNQGLCQLLSRISGVPLAELEQAISPTAPLLASGLVRLENTLAFLEGKLDLLEGLSGIMLSPHDDVDQLITRFLRPVAGSSLGLDDFPHLSDDAALLVEYLRQSMSAGVAGANVLLYGPPGVGKTEFVQTLADALGVHLYEIDYADAEGDPARGAARLRAYSFCQRLLAERRDVLLMFDDVEDVFQAEEVLFSLSDIGHGCRTPGKAWLNRVLESNPVPAIWISNKVRHMDPAFLRRFDYSVEFRVPPRRVRQNIVRHHLEDLAVSDEWMAALAENEHLTPAQFRQAARVAKLVSAEDAPRATAAAEQTLRRSAQLLRQARTTTQSRSHTGYDLRFINADLDPARLLAGLRRRPQASLCFFGPPGTGKTELGRYLADALDMPLVIRRASDLLSKWLGETEQNIAAMFEAARSEEAVLLLDEADSFLADRRDAQRSWEVTQVNELLTQMEAFEGIFICTTNLMEKLDAASLRRFAFKVRFDFLKPDQGWAMFLQELERLGGDTAGAPAWERAVRALSKLTPGDFSVAARQIALSDEAPSAELLYRLIEAECRLKPGGGGRIGFV